MNSKEPDETPKPAEEQPQPAAPDPVTPSSAEVVEDIDAYQRRIEREWESARAAYQSRLADIMDDVLKNGAGRTPPGEHAKRFEKDGETAPDPGELLARAARRLREKEGRATGAPALPLPKGYARRRALKRAGWAAAVAAVIAAAAFAFRMPAWTPLPYQRTGGVAIYDGKIFVADWFRKTLYIHAAKRGAPIVSVESLPVGLVAGLSPDANGLWTADALSGDIVRHAASADRQVIRKVPGPDARPSALYQDGGDLWVAGAEAKKLFRIRSDDPEEVKESFDLPLDNVVAIQIKDKRLWALDGEAREVSVFRVQSPLKALATFDLDPFLRGGSPTGFAISGNTAWIVTENPSALLRISISRLKKTKSTDF